MGGETREKQKISNNQVDELQEDLRKANANVEKLTKQKDAIETKLVEALKINKKHKDVEEMSEKSSCEILLMRNKVEEMERKMVVMKEAATADKEENNRLHKMLQEQQKVIKTALQRIFPRKQNNISFCEDHLKTIRAYEDRGKSYR